MELNDFGSDADLDQLVPPAGASKKKLRTALSPRLDTNSPKSKARKKIMTIADVPASSDGISSFFGPPSATSTAPSATSSLCRVVGQYVRMWWMSQIWFCFGYMIQSTERMSTL